MVFAGKWWGESQEQPIVAFHGLHDNAASFDLLARHLDVPAFLALDLPGHGFSSHFPRGMCSNWAIMMSAIRYLVKFHFKWPTVSLLGHSYGSSLVLTYAALYPKETHDLITVDCARAVQVVDDYVDSWRRNADLLLYVDSETSTQTPLSYKEALDKVSTRSYPFTKELSKHIASRSLSNIGYDQYVLNNDLRLSGPSIGGNSLEGVDTIVANITCNVLNVMASNGILSGGIMDIMVKHNSTMSEKCRHFECREIKGSHHVHMDNPEEVAAAINQFFKTLDQA